MSGPDFRTVAWSKSLEATSRPGPILSPLGLIRKRAGGYEPVLVVGTASAVRAV